MAMLVGLISIRMVPVDADLHGTRMASPVGRCQSTSVGAEAVDHTSITRMGWHQARAGRQLPHKRGLPCRDRPFRTESGPSGSAEPENVSPCVLALDPRCSEPQRGGRGRLDRMVGIDWMIWHARSLYRRTCGWYAARTIPSNSFCCKDFACGRFDS